MVVYKAIIGFSGMRIGAYIVEIEVERKYISFRGHDALYNDDIYYVEKGTGKVISIYDKWTLKFASEVEQCKNRKNPYFIPRVYSCNKIMNFPTFVWLKRESAYLYKENVAYWKRIKESDVLKKLEGRERWCK